MIIQILLMIMKNTVDDNDNKEEGNNDDNGQVTCEQCQLLQFGVEDDGD